MEEQDSTEEDLEKEQGVEKRFDVDAFLSDFADWLGRRTSESRGHRVVKNFIHMGMTLITAGVYAFMYTGYYVYKFVDQANMEKFRYEVEVSKVEEKEEERQE